MVSKKHKKSSAEPFDPLRAGTIRLLCEIIRSCENIDNSLHRRYLQGLLLTEIESLTISSSQSVDPLKDASQIGGLFSKGL